MSKESSGEPIKITMIVAILGVAAACISLAAAGLEMIPSLLDRTPTGPANSAAGDISEALTAEHESVAAVTPTPTTEPTPPESSPDTPPVTPQPLPPGPLSLDNDFSTGFLGLTVERDGACDVTLDAQSAVSSIAERAAGKTRCSLVVSSQASLALFRIAEAEMKAMPGMLGESLAHYWEIMVSGAQHSGQWSVMCGFRWTEGQGHQQFVQVTAPNGTVEFEQYVQSVADKWFHVRLEADPATGQITCLSNDRQLGTHIPSAAADLRLAADLVLQITTVWETNSHGVFLTDNVYVGQ